MNAAPIPSSSLIMKGGSLYPAAAEMNQQT